MVEITASILRSNIKKTITIHGEAFMLLIG